MSSDPSNVLIKIIIRNTKHAMLILLKATDFKVTQYKSKFIQNFSFLIYAFKTFKREKCLGSLF